MIQLCNPKSARKVSGLSRTDLWRSWQRDENYHRHTNPPRMVYFCNQTNPTRMVGIPIQQEWYIFVTAYLNLKYPANAISCIIPLGSQSKFRAQTETKYHTFKATKTVLKNQIFLVPYCIHFKQGTSDLIM